MRPLNKAEQAVIVHFLYGNSWTGSHSSSFVKRSLKMPSTHPALVTMTETNLANDGSDGVLYMYGPDADRLFAFVRPYLVGNTLLKGVEVTIRYGAANDPKVKQRVVKLGNLTPR